MKVQMVIVFERENETCSISYGIVTPIVMSSMVNDASVLSWCLFSFAPYSKWFTVPFVHWNNQLDKVKMILKILLL